MNEFYILKIKFLLGFIDKKDIVVLCENLINLGNQQEEILELSSLKNDNNQIVSWLNQLARSKTIDSDQIKKHFYNLFLSKLMNNKNTLDLVESYLVSFYNITEGELTYSYDEKLSYSIIENDLSLRREGHGYQITLNDLISFLKFEKNII